MPAFFVCLSCDSKQRPDASCFAAMPSGVDFFQALLALESLEESASDGAAREQERCAPAIAEESDIDESPNAEPEPLIRDETKRVRFALDWAGDKMVSHIEFRPSATCQGVGGFAPHEFCSG